MISFGHLHIVVEGLTILYLYLGAFAKLRKAIIYFVISVGLSVRPHGITWLPLYGFS
jgi:zinc transporter ZupT